MSRFDDVFEEWLRIHEDQRLAKIELALRRIEERIRTMVTKADFDAAIAEVNANLDQGQVDIDALEAKIAELTASINTGGLTAEEEAAALADVQALRDRVAALNADAETQTPE